MTGERKKEVLKSCLRKNFPLFLLFFVISVLNLTVFLLYDLYMEPFVYGEILGLTALIIIMICLYRRELKKVSEMDLRVESTLSNRETVYDGSDPLRADYERIIDNLYREIDRMSAEMITEREETEDYYTAWVHQIKTPIAVMKLRLGEQEPELNRELFRIEEYVDMVLHYVRLGSTVNDLVIEEYSVDNLIRESIRKYAPEFILKKLSLRYEGTSEKIVTDRKWFSVILDQLLSNAVKYTVVGGITVRVTPGEVRVTDTGVGIPQEDLPRIFEKGYTGLNGRLGHKSSGLGLFMAKKAADKLNLRLSAESTPGKGSSFIISLPFPGRE